MTRFSYAIDIHMAAGRYLNGKDCDKANLRRNWSE